MNMHRDAMVYDHDAEIYDQDSGKSNFVAYLLGGLVIGVGLLAFLFYDEANMGGRDVMTTGSTLPRIEAPAAPVTTPAAPSPAR